MEGWKSVNIDPADYSAHRLLADSYSILPRHDIARVSELLQSQLLQPLNINPVQPQLAESNLFILEGAGTAAPAFNEFNPLFARNRLTLQASGVFGSNDTLGDEVVHSGLWNNLSYSVGQFHYETNGFRANNDLRHDLVTGFFQGSLSQNLSVQAEVRHKEFERGDIRLFADSPVQFDPNARREITTDTVRTGAHYAIDQQSDVIGSFIHQEGDDSLAFTSVDTTGNPIVVRLPFSTFGNSGEAQYLFRTERFSTVTGVGYSSSGVTPSGQPDQVTSHANGYLYSYMHYPQDLTWTLGLSFDSLNDVSDSFEQANPKFGLVWRARPDTTLRLAAFRTLKRPLITNQTIEPTQVAGFNQFFDDVTATEARRYGIAMDHHFTTALYGGLEFSARELKVPRSRAPISDWEERSYRAYLAWAPNPRVAVKLAYELEEFEGATTTSDLVPENTTTHQGEASFRFFDSSGLYSNIDVIYTNQKAVVAFLPTPSHQNEFVIVNAGLGYRLLKRYGLLGIDLRNLFDEEFAFQDLGLRRAVTSESESPPFFPERTIFARFTFAF